MSAGSPTALSRCSLDAGARQGQVAVNASVAGYGGLPTSAAYGATKAALINMTESLKFGIDREGITMQVVMPGFVGTPLTDKNEFPMPFLIPAEDAARRICDGFERAGFEIAFPRRMAWLLKAINLLPYALYFPVVARFTGFDRRTALGARSAPRRLSIVAAASRCAPRRAGSTT